MLADPSGVSLRLAILLALLASACAGPMAPAKKAFDRGYFPEAADDFRALEADARSWPEPERLRYALYRGLTHLAVGDAHAAAHWLERAWWLHERHPRELSPAERGQLVSAWRSMGHMPGER